MLNKICVTVMVDDIHDHKNVLTDPNGFRCDLLWYNAINVISGSPSTFPLEATSGEWFTFFAVKRLINLIGYIKLVCFYPTASVILQWPNCTKGHIYLFVNIGAMDLTSPRDLKRHLPGSCFFLVSFCLPHFFTRIVLAMLKRISYLDPPE